MISFHRAIFRAYNNFSPELENKDPAMKNKTSPIHYAERRQNPWALKLLKIGRRSLQLIIFPTKKKEIGPKTES